MSNPTATPQASAQEAQYDFPYHYVPRVQDGAFRLHEVLDWGHEYLAYMTHVADLVSQREWSSILDVGCGDGRLISMLSSAFPERRTVGLDYSERAIRLARALAPGGEFVAGDVTDPTLFAEPFDGVTCVETLEHIEPDFLPSFVRGIRSHVKPGGFLIVTVPSTNMRLVKKHYQHFTADTLRATLEGPFRVDQIYYINGNSRPLELLRKLVANRVYTLTHRRLLTAFYRHYRQRYLMSDPRRGGRLVALATAS